MAAIFVVKNKQTNTSFIEADIYLPKKIEFCLLWLTGTMLFIHSKPVNIIKWFLKTKWWKKYSFILGVQVIHLFCGKFLWVYFYFIEILLSHCYQMFWKSLQYHKRDKKKGAKKESKTFFHMLKSTLLVVFSEFHCSEFRQEQIYNNIHNFQKGKWPTKSPWHFMPILSFIHQAAYCMKANGDGWVCLCLNNIESSQPYK